MKIKIIIASIIVVIAVVCTIIVVKLNSNLVVTSIGDSISTGFGLKEYTKDGEPCATSWVDMFVEKVGATKVNRLGLCGSTTDKTLSYFAEAAYQEAVKEADVILLQTGSSDLLVALADVVFSAAEVKDENELISKAVLLATTDPDAAIEYLFGLVDSIMSNEAQIKYESVIAQAEENVIKILDKVIELNPDAKIIMPNTYNPYGNIKVVFDGETYETKEFSSELIGKMNNVYDKLTEEPYKEKYDVELVDISALDASMINADIEIDPQNGKFSPNIDPHPNAAGHKYIFEAIEETLGESLTGSLINKMR